MSTNKFEEFLGKVTSKVKSKEAHSLIRKELRNHLQELRQSYQQRESSKEEAEEKAIEEMGNPFTLGESLNQLHKPKMDWVLIVLFGIIAVISFLPLINGVYGLPNSVTKQAIWYTLAALTIITLLFFDYRKLKNLWMFFYGIGLIMHVYTYFFGIMVSGAKNWIAFPGVTLHVPMITLFLFILAWAGIFTRINEFASRIKQVVLFFLFWIPILIYLMLPDLMVGFIYLICIVTMFAFSPVQKKLAIKLIIVNVVLGVCVIGAIMISTLGNYIHDRLSFFLNPNTYPDGEGYISNQIREVLSQAGWFGNGINSELHSLPNVHTDFVFPYLVYSLGWAFGITLCLILSVFILRISLNAFKTKDLYGRLIVIGGAVFFTVPTILNIFMGLGLVPVIGVSLPFVSYGGSMLVVSAAMLGLILSIYRRKDMVEATVLTKYKKTID
ncbi:FtsW/RodA/SpoVE family cell cycle protein [Aquibacillus rhizosphaerae]|uniref:FtsW/RodA/SpoVE family cell cycle protein n=1 Tax=Aquibacillus rhizosphaerae TaxID=3051431 RepID=A0ABT7L9B1_9BACI|nr:FtsW/RodA/SpoVE family cell cycle protein [Aquibacillus sp. LR5S19]MDL4842448.1 FtsW/RodA/SpoVE family cell cycle protein [Aquibacillus sp. LR5S19]